MPAESRTSDAPLVARRRARQSWFTRNVSQPLERLNPSLLFARRRRPAVARSVYINTDIPGDFFDKKGRALKDKTFATNQVVTSKYTVLTFVPRNLLEQFRRVANIFFLGIAILQFFPKFSTISPGLVILPLLIVLAITAGKDGYEDVKRHQADHKINHSIVHVLGGDGYTNANPMGPKSKTFTPAIPMPRKWSKKAKKGQAGTTDILEQDRVNVDDGVQGLRPAGHTDRDANGLERVRSQVSTWEDDPEAGDSPNELGWQRTNWEDVRVGDFVKLYDNEQIPADVVICATSEEEDVAYIETKNLDGETNLKSRHGITGLQHLNTIEACRTTRLRIDVDEPEVNMYRLNGAAVVLDESGHDGEPAVHPITLETTLLRGCVVKNTAWVIGIVIFTGEDTKIVQNSGGAPSKRSKVERQMNPQVLFNLCVLATIATVCAIVDHVDETNWYQDNTYWTLYDDTGGDNPRINGLVSFANAFITFQNIVPISLYISIEAVRTFQALFIHLDHSMKYVKNGVTTRTVARSWNLSDDLGQIEYIFSDKTGTLTQNAMIFRQCSVGGKIYTGDGEVPSNVITDKPSSDSDDSDSAQNNGVKVALPKEVLAPFHDAQLDKDLEDHESEQSRILHGFFAVLGLCHTVLAAEPEPGVIEYKAQSPDEAALVQSAADVGFVFRGRDRNILRMSTPFADEPDEYELLHVLEFTSARKRMSVVVRKLDEDQRLFLLVKGADNVIFERLGKDSQQTELRQKTDADLQHFASEGLRTLCLAYKVLDPKMYDAWAREYHDATVALQDREARIEDVSARIENDLTLLGATAIEDKLQDGVPEAIADLKRAGIRVWVATGDKLETAVAIGYTTNLLTPDTNLIIVRQGNHTIHDQLRDALEGFFGGGDVDLAPTHSRSGHPQLARVNTGVQSLVGRDNGTRPGGFSLVIEGGALTEAFNDEDTADLLLALSTQCNTVVCCRVSPLQKAQIVHLIKDNLGVMTLAIGDGANDVSMIQAADVGVGISGEEGLQAVNSSDYAIAQFRFLRPLLLVHGHWSYFRNSTMICNFFYKNIVGIGVLFWFQIYCGWSTTYVYAYVYLLFWNVFWTLAPVIAIGIFERNIDAETLVKLPELYRYGREGKYYNWPRFLYYLMEGVYQTAVIYFILCYTYVTTSTRGDGWEVYIYEMSTTMAIAAVMVANLFSGLNIDAWTGWVWFAVFLGPFLIWVFTAIYSIIPPSSFYTGIYGNDIWLFRSAAFWFGWPLVLVLALLPRYIIKAVKQNYIPTDVELMRLVRKYHPEADPATHPLLGGKLAAAARGEHDDADTFTRTESSAAGRPHTPIRDVEDGIAMREMASPGGDKMGRMGAGAAGRPSMQGGRPSMSSQRFGVLSSARGSQVDMSTGLSREASRGFDFTMEERGVAMARMQSRLSQTSQQRTAASRLRLFTPQRNGDRRGSGSAGAAAATTPTSAGFGFGGIRQRAGTILGRNRGARRQSVADPARDESARAAAEREAKVEHADDDAHDNVPARGTGGATTGRGADAGPRAEHDPFRSDDDGAYGSAIESTVPRL
ncbi:hypothetical protein Q5752_002678 [Cryptotrichosporon argae]